jgi:hypothetical protein
MPSRSSGETEEDGIRSVSNAAPHSVALLSRENVPWWLLVVREGVFRLPLDILAPLVVPVLEHPLETLLRDVEGGVAVVLVGERILACTPRTRSISGRRAVRSSVW